MTAATFNCARGHKDRLSGSQMQTRYGDTADDAVLETSSAQPSRILAGGP